MRGFRCRVRGRAQDWRQNALLCFDASQRFFMRECWSTALSGKLCG